MEQMRCPVCGQLNKHDTSHEGFWLVEEHYYCPNCSYFIEMAYSHPVTGVVEGKFTGYEKEVADLELKVWSERDAYNIIN